MFFKDLTHMKHLSISVSFFHTHAQLVDNQEKATALRPCGSPRITFYIRVITALISWHSACESYEIRNTSCAQSCKPFL